MMFKKNSEPDSSTLSKPTMSAAAPISIAINYNGESTNSSMFTLPVKSLPLWAKKDVTSSSSALHSPDKSTVNPMSQSVEPKWAIRADSSSSTVLKSYRQKLLDNSASNSTSAPNTNAFGRPYTDSSSTSSSVRNEDEVNTDGSDVPSSGLNSRETVQQLKDKFGGYSTLKSARQRTTATQPTIRGATMKSSVSVPNFDRIEGEEEDDVNTNAQINPIAQSGPKKNPLYVSTENLRPNPHDTSQNELLDDKASVHSSTSGVSSRTPGPKPSPAARPSLLTLSRGLSSSKLNAISPGVSRENGSDCLNGGPKPPISKRREELAKAISEARMKLKTVSYLITSSHCFVLEIITVFPFNDLFFFLFCVSNSLE
jgi:hypothetical protein